MEQIRKTEVEERKANNAGDGVNDDLEAIRTDDEDVEEAYEAWKVRIKTITCDSLTRNCCDQELKA